MTWLLILLLLIAVAVLVFLPRYGILPRYNKNKKLQKRILVEDALKHLYDAEYKNTTASFNSIAGSLQVTTAMAAEIVQHLKTSGLITSTSGNLPLTEKGRAYALRIIRVHRLLEQYYAQETGFGVTDWHREAEALEHHITPEETEELAAKIGNPLVDPHGDPIPAADGEMPPDISSPLLEMKPGDIVEVLHLEDEPHSVYDELLKLGLYPGLIMRIDHIEPGSVTLFYHGHQKKVTASQAENVSVKTTDAEVIEDADVEPLSLLRAGEEAEVVSIARTCIGLQRRRLMDLGIVRGSRIRAELVSFSGDPVAYLVKGSLVALRRKQSSQIYIRKVS